MRSETWAKQSKANVSGIDDQAAVVQRCAIAEDTLQVVQMLKRLSYSTAYSSTIGVCVRSLGLRELLQRAYAKLNRTNGVLELSLNGIEARFAARTPHELRCVEGAWFLELELLNRLSCRLRPGDVFLDVGSNLGLFTIFAAKMVGPNGTVLSFEPETVAYGRLAENVRLNGLTNVRPFKLALSDVRASRKLAVPDTHAVSQTARLTDEDGPSETVETANFDWLAAEQSLPTPNVVKVDVEGHEFAALRGMSSALSARSCDTLLCEIHPDLLPGITAQDVIALMKSMEFDNIVSKRRSDQLHAVARKSSASWSRTEAREGQALVGVQR